MVGVALALGGFVSLYMTSYVSSSSRMASLSVTDVELMELNDHVYFLITLRNTGNVPLTVVNVTIHTPGQLYYAKQPFSLSISPGASLTLTEQELAKAGCSLNPGDFEPGSDYLVRVYVEGAGSYSACSIIATCQG